MKKVLITVDEKMKFKKFDAKQHRSNLTHFLIHETKNFLPQNFS